jgi:hypothetical protein
MINKLFLRHRWLSLVMLLLLNIGCTSVQIPGYLKDSNPYSKRFYSDFAKTRAATEEVLHQLGWKVAERLDPLVYEQAVVNDLDEERELLVTEARQMPLFIGTRYARMNIYIRSKKDISEVEIRYLTITSMLFKNFTSYRNNAAAERIFTRIEEHLAPGQK